MLRFILANLALMGLKIKKVRVGSSQFGSTITRYLVERRLIDEINMCTIESIITHGRNNYSRYIDIDG